jgi:uncharacterized protein YgiM (DUF1202 family)
LNKLLNKNKTKNYIFFLIVALLLLLISNSSYQNKIDKKEGIIFSSPAEIYSEPIKSSRTTLTIRLGTKIEIIRRDNDFIQIKESNGNSGWIAQNSIKEL